MKNGKYTFEEAIDFIFTHKYYVFISKALELHDKTDEEINEETTKLVMKINKLLNKEEQNTAVLLRSLIILTAKIFSDTAIKKMK